MSRLQPPEYYLDQEYLLPREGNALRCLKGYADAVQADDEGLVSQFLSTIHSCS